MDMEVAPAAALALRPADQSSGAQTGAVSE
jgi:hypothetical protein